MPEDTKRHSQSHGAHQWALVDHCRSISSRVNIKIRIRVTVKFSVGFQSYREASGQPEPRSKLDTGLLGLPHRSGREGRKHQLNQKAFEADPITAGLLRLLCFPVRHLHHDGGGRVSTLTIG